MISIGELEKIANERLAYAEWLIKGQRFDSAIYLCGYCLEIAFKVRLCKDAGRADFPETSLEFKQHNLKHWQTHSLQELSALCHLDGLFKKKYQPEFFSIRRIWSVEMRYKTSYLQKEDANDFFEAIKKLLKVIL
jgi:HEPN domain-containing protein